MGTISDLRNIGQWHSIYKSIEKKERILSQYLCFLGESGVVQILTLDSEKNF